MAKSKSQTRLPRDSGGSLELEGGTGGITGVCPCGKFLEIYKRDRTFRIQSPESIDPDRTNPNAPFLAAQSDTVGSASHAVARILLQGVDILKAVITKRPVDQSKAVETLHACKEAVVVCEKVSARVVAEVDAIVTAIKQNGLKRDKHGRALNPFPQVANLEAEATSYLIHSKRAIREICRLPSVFLGVPPKDSNFDALGKTLSSSIGDQEPVTQFVLANARNVEHLIDLRNYQEHPGDKRTVIENFALMPNGTISVPTWHVSGNAIGSIREEMLSGVNFLVETAEAMLIHLVLTTADDRYAFVVHRLDDSKVDPNKPIRYRLSLDLSKMKIKKANPAAPPPNLSDDA